MIFIKYYSNTLLDYNYWQTIIIIDKQYKTYVYIILSMSGNNIKFEEEILTSSISAVASQNTTPLDEQVRQYVLANNPKMFILTPCYGGMCFVNYVHCLMSTVELFKQVNFPLQIEFCKNDSLVPRARNNLVARAMGDPEMTHMIFIDADITWNPVDILKLALSQKPIIGGIYPLKHYNWDKLAANTNLTQSLINKKNGSQLRTMMSDADMIQHNLLSYNLNYSGSQLSIENNLTQVKHLATGFMMIQRDVIEKMMKAFPSTKYVDDVHFLRPEENEFAFALFDCGVEEGHYYSEDWMFCHRWTKMKGSIWADVSINLTHSGIEDYSGSFVASII